MKKGKIGKIEEVDKRLYQLTQTELIHFIQEYLNENNIKYNIDEYGNIWSIRFPDRPAFVSHMDTINTDERVEVIELFDMLIRPGYVLGADDRAGVNAILLNAKNFNFVFTVDEEIGAIGANYLSKNPKFIDECSNISFFCELDRRNGTDLLANIHGYCDEGLEDLIMDVAAEKEIFLESTRGAFTDIDKFDCICQGVNLSIGYYNPHSSTEYLYIPEYKKILELIKDINKISYENNVYWEPIVPKKNIGGITSYWTTRGDDDYYFDEDAWLKGSI